MRRWISSQIQRFPTVIYWYVWHCISTNVSIVLLL